MNRILILFTVLFLAYSCHDKDVAKINLSDEEQYSLIALEKDYKLSDEVTTKILTDFISGNGLASSRSTSSIKIGKIDKKLHIKPGSLSRAGEIEADTVVVCEIEVDNNNSTGFAIVVADKRFPGVIAYAENGSLKDTLENKGLAICLSRLSYYINSRLDKFSTVKKAYLKSAQEKSETGSYDPVTPRRTNGKEDGSFSYHTEKGAFTQTLWDQDYPYNEGIYCAIHPDRSAPAGCVAISVAQIMAYHRFPATFNWNLLLKSPSISIFDQVAINEVSRLIRDIGSKVHMVYDCSAGSSSDIYKANTALKGYGFSTDGVKSYDINTVMGSINNSRPVMMRGFTSTGEGHDWIIDGYRIGTISAVWGSRRDPDQQVTYYGTAHYFHMNFGWGGLCNLWFVVKEEMGSDYPGRLPVYKQDFFADGNHFTEDFKILPNIRH